MYCLTPSFLISYHATAPADEALKLTRQKIPSAAALQLKSLAFDDFGLLNDETLQVNFHEISSASDYVF